MSVILYDATIGALTVKQCSAAEFSPNNRIEAVRGSGGISPAAFHLLSGEPRARWTTMDLATVLAALDEITGLAVSGAGGAVVTLPWRVRSAGGTVVSGANNVSITSRTTLGKEADALAIPISVTAQQDSLATMALEAVWSSPLDGNSSPVVFATGVTLSAPTFTGTFRLGPTSLNGSGVTGIVGITVNFGISVELERTDGATWPLAIYIPEANPTVDIQLRNHSLVNTYGPLFAASTGAVFSLIANAEGGSIQALTEAEHITFTLGAGIYDWQNLSAQDRSIAVPTLRLFGKDLTVATGATLA